MKKAAGRRRKNAKSKRKTRATGPTRATSRPPSTRTARPTAGPASGATRTAKAGAGSPSRIIAPWWERWPGRLKWELEQLTAKGLQVDIDEASRQRQQVVLRVVAPAAGENHTFTVVFPDFYPELRFEVYAPTLDLPRHQNPFGKNLCLLEGATEQWRLTDSAAAFLTERVPKLLDLLEDEEAMRQAEVPQGEPITAYYQYKLGGVVLVPAFALTLPRDCASGLMHLRLQEGANTATIRCLLSEAMDEDSRTLGKAEPELAEMFSGTTVVGRWFRLDEAPHTEDGPSLVQLLSGKFPYLMKPRWRSLQGRKVDFVGVVFPEEVTQNRFEDAWLLVVRERTGSTYLCRGQRVTEEDLLARIPELRALRSCTVGVIGLGGLGGPSALEFARCQIGQLRVLDYDIVEAGTLVRWPFGLPFVGLPKTEVIGEIIQKNYPFTRLERYSLRIGAVEMRKQPRSQRELLGEFLDGLDLVYDATAQSGVQYLVSILAGERKLPQVYVGGTYGGWGGMVARCIPNKTGCWYCWKLHLDAGTLPPPNSQPDGLIQPRGCASRTFTGCSFDLLPIVAQGVRMSVQTLVAKSNTEGSRYPQSDRDVSILYLRDDKGNPTGCPRWEHHKLEIHPRCELCAKT